jgi:hypothetical protein
VPWGPTTGTPPREMTARLATAIQQRLMVVLEVAEQVLEAPDPSQFGPHRLLIPLVGLLIGVYLLFLVILSNSVLNNALESLAFQ